MPITDDFNRADGGLGSGWELVSGSAWAIVSNVAKPTGTNQNTAVRRTESFPNDHYAQCKGEWTDPLLGGNSRAGIAARVQANGDCYRVTYENNDVVLRKQIGAGAGTYLSDWIISATTPSTFHTLKISVSGSIISVFFDGTLLGTVTDTDLIGGKPGMFQVTGQSSLIARHDDFESTDAQLIPPALAINLRTLDVSWVDNQSFLTGWIDNRSIEANWIDDRRFDLT